MNGFVICFTCLLHVLSLNTTCCLSL